MSSPSTPTAGGGGHARALLESLLATTATTSSTSTSTTPSSSSTSVSPNPLSTSTASSSSTSTPSNGYGHAYGSHGGQLHLNPTFRLHRPSSLSSFASASASEEDGAGDRRASRLKGHGRDDDDDEEDDDDESEMATSPPFSASFKAAQLSMQALHQHRTPSASAASTLQTRASCGVSPTHEHVAEILALLNNAELDEEERIDRVRATLSTALSSSEGVVSTPARLDSLVLELLHRHREDRNPTGASFAPSINASPARRPASIRSFSLSRPWTPSKPPFTSAHSTPGPPGLGGGGNGNGNGNDGVGGLLHQATSPLMSSIGIPPPGLAAASSSGGSPKPHPGVIGSGSPRASPRPWNRTLSHLSIASVSSSLGGETSMGSPISSIPPGLSVASTSTSRPASPSPFSSPRLNVAATEFRPKNISTASLAATSSGPTPARTAPWLARRPSSNASSTNLALANKTHAGAGDDDDDEFSPFGTTKSVPWATGGHDGASEVNWYSSGASAASSNGGGGSGSAGGLGPGPGAGAAVLPADLDGDDEAAGFGSAGMTPFDLLYSILVTETKQGMAEWSPEQVDEALMANGYDFERTLNAISENGGKPLGDGSRSILSGAPGTVKQWGAAAAGATAASSPRLEHATAAATASAASAAPNIRAGVNVLNREAFSSMHRNGGRFGSAARLNGSNSNLGAGRGYSPTPASASALAPMSPGVTPAGLAGALHGAKVCRYFLAGECRRSDCKFSHDLGRAVCRYWLKGQCAHNPCNFLHDYEALNVLAAGITGAQVDDGLSPAGGDSEVAASTTKAASDDFPELGLGAASTGPKAAAAVSNRGRWSAALQRNNNSPLALAQKEGQAVISLHSKAGGLTRPAGASSSSSSAQQQQQQKAGDAGGARGSARIALRAPLLLPTIATGRQAASSYAAHRGSSLALAEQRNRLLARASDAFRRGDFAAAKRWSHEAAEINDRFQDQSRGAAREILRDRMTALRARLTDPVEAGSGVAANQSDEPGTRGVKGKVVGNGLGLCLGVVKASALQVQMPSSMAAHLSVDERTESFLDLHGLHSQEAVEVVEEFLLGLEREGIQGLAYLAIGRERHSSKETDKRRVKVASFVKQFLGSYSYPFAEWDGVLVVDQLTHKN